MKAIVTTPFTQTKFFLFFLLLFPLFSFTIKVNTHADAITGKWMSAENNLIVEVFKTGNEYKARVVWFDDNKDINRPMNVRCDYKNPNEALRSRKIIGMEIMHGLVYNIADDEWQEGRIYDPTSGKDWNAKASIAPDGNLKVRGFWHFEFLGQNMKFKKIL